MADTIRALRQQRAEAQDNLRLIQERKAKYVLETDVPLQLEREQRRLEARIEDLAKRLVRLSGMPCPYRGLEPFEAQHAKFYFGRDEMVKRLVDKVGQSHFVAVVGPSGCGKSSLARAGLVTALGEGRLPGSQRWTVRVFRPGGDPLHQLATQLIDLLEPEAGEVAHMAEARQLADHLRDETLSMVDVATRLREKRPEIPHILLIVDQFEELYTECTDEVLRQAFTDALLRAAEQEITVVLMLRADFYGRVLADRELGHAVDAGLVNVLPMGETELRMAIEKPALWTGNEFEPGLVERILKDVEGEPGNLSLLEFALMELWQRQTMAGTLTHKGYEEIGTVQGAIARRAETVYGKLDQEGQAETVQRILLRLTVSDVGEATRRRATIDELVTPRTPRRDIEAAIKVLADARLVVTAQDQASKAATVEVSHEALIRNWERLQRWLNDDRAFGIWRGKLAARRQAWDETRRDDGALLRGALLEEARQWLDERPDDINLEERQYVLQSIVADEERGAARKWAQLLYYVLAGLMGGAVGASLGTTASFVVEGELYEPGVMANVVGSGMFGAILASSISLGVGLSSVIHTRIRTLPIFGGALGGVFSGALLGLFWGPAMSIGPLAGAMWGIFLGAAYGGGIALGVVIGRRLWAWKRILIRTLIPAVLGGLIGLLADNHTFGVCVAAGTGAALGAVDDRFKSTDTAARYWLRLVKAKGGDAMLRDGLEIEDRLR